MSRFDDRVVKKAEVSRGTVSHVKLRTGCSHRAEARLVKEKEEGSSLHVYRRLASRAPGVNDRSTLTRCAGPSAG